MRRWWLGGLAGALLCAGCDLGTMTYFLTPESKEPPELRALADAKDKKKEVKVAILVYNQLDPIPELIQVDRQLSELLGKDIMEMAAANEEKITVIPQRRIEDYKNREQSRYGPSPEELGKHFKVDYVIYLELNSMDLYESGRNSQLLHGRAQITVSVFDIHNPDDVRESKEFNCVYPSAFPKDVDEMPLALFKQKFLDHIARRLTYYFVAHSKRDRMVDVE
jgi:hypothetical protein